MRGLYPPPPQGILLFLFLSGGSERREVPGRDDARSWPGAHLRRCSSIGRASAFQAEGRGFDPRHRLHRAKLPSPFNDGPERREVPCMVADIHGALTQGYRQAVRHGNLTPASVGSNPAIPAIPHGTAPIMPSAREGRLTTRRCWPYAHVAQLVEQRPFKAWVGGSIPFMGTT